MAATNTFLAKLVRAWPALPYMALGALLASVYIASSGTAWLSDTEMNGGNLSTLIIASSLAFGAVMLAGTFAAPRVRVGLEKPFAALWGGAMSSAGSLLVILIGPYYFYYLLPGWAIMTLFIFGAVLFGAGLGVVALRCGQLFGALPPRQVILYVAYSQFVVGASFFIVVGSPAWAPVSGGPSLAGILVFVLLPAAAGFLAMLSRYNEQPTQGLERSLSRASLPKSFWKLLAVVFVFSCIVSSVYASSVAISSIDTTLNGSRLVMLVRMVLALALAVVAVGTEGDRLNFGKLYSVVMVVSVALVACLPLVTVLHTVLSQIVSLASVVFELFLWCTLAFIVFQRRVSAVIVFGYGYGAYQLGNGIGWLSGAQALGSLFGAVGEAFAYMIMALIVLACAFVIFSEREFDRLFIPQVEGAPTLDELLMQDLTAERAEEGEGDEPAVKKGRFGVAIEELTETYQLSPRETDVLRCLAMGYNSSTTASKLHISWNTVRTHTRNVYGKLGVHSQQELIALVDEATAGE
ncbi:LuxR C-terminal-related transcriptional regulator [Adlercreutzia sp. R25]|uniref:helix-turn-helix transcriptional regulator n=1 Tax=Adlercreutzia shanghongiae TaxID=3111773 RepID=UPI002DB6FB64|nr:LuxR C-terminal-related transcriptional regulator [Adlercreutzia sp. R25]MEC4273316.1 LuxR C-terminal-related transcriptional regulator [Adlercreutzia sp. R25]